MLEVSPTYHDTGSQTISAHHNSPHPTLTLGCTNTVYSPRVRVLFCFLCAPPKTGSSCIFSDLFLVVPQGHAHAATQSHSYKVHAENSDVVSPACFLPLSIWNLFRHVCLLAATATSRHIQNTSCKMVCVCVFHCLLGCNTRPAAVTWEVHGTLSCVQRTDREWKPHRAVLQRTQTGLHILGIANTVNCMSGIALSANDMHEPTADRLTKTARKLLNNPKAGRNQPGMSPLGATFGSP